MLRTAMAIAGCLLLTCGAPDDATVSGSHASSALTLGPHARSAAEVPVCHRAGGGWVPLSLPEAAVKRHVGKHGDFVYDASAGECCTDADCGAGLPCTVGPDGDSVIGMCPIARGGTINDPIAFLLAMGIFGSANGTTPPFPAVLIRGSRHQPVLLVFRAERHRCRSSAGKFRAQQRTTLAENSSTPVTVIFPPRNAGLIKYDAPA